MNVLSAVLDIMVAVTIILVTATSIRRGMIVSIIEFVGMILSTVASAFLASMSSSLIYAQFIKNSIVETISRAILDTDKAASVSAFNSLPIYVQSDLLSRGINEKNILSNINGSDIPSAVEAIIRPTVVSLITKIAVTVIFTILFVIVIALTTKFSKKAHMSELSAPEKLMSGVFGFLKSVIILMIVAILIQIIVLLISQESVNAVNSAIDNSFLYKLINGVNIPLFVINLTMGI